MVSLVPSGRWSHSIGVILEIPFGEAAGGPVGAGLLETLLERGEVGLDDGAEVVEEGLEGLARVAVLVAHRPGRGRVDGTLDALGGAHALRYAGLGGVHAPAGEAVAVERSLELVHALQECVDLFEHGLVCLGG